MGTKVGGTEVHAAGWGVAEEEEEEKEEEE